MAKKKKYYQSIKDRMHERAGARAELKTSGEGLKGGESGSYACMPQHVIMKNYEEMAGGMPWAYDDSVAGIDKQIRQDHSKMMSEFKPRKA
jgi:hypothetical protein